MLYSTYLWHSKNLKTFLVDPKAMIPGTKCGLEPIKEDAVATDLIQFLKELTLANYSVIRSMVVNYYKKKFKPPIAQDYQFSRENSEIANPR